ncbi:hypothetical protein SDC9_109371 [bioreactor metagenome]|uniref:Uncharacterized protein n=1 Tax=bioreactor metagenome TaxID=1076179 RepID=A0A645BBQ6_9ZZZZ
MGRCFLRLIGRINNAAFAHEIQGSDTDPAAAGHGMHALACKIPDRFHVVYSAFVAFQNIEKDFGYGHIIQ